MIGCDDVTYPSSALVLTEKSDTPPKFNMEPENDGFH